MKGRPAASARSTWNRVTDRAALSVAGSSPDLPGPASSVGAGRMAGPTGFTTAAGDAKPHGSLSFAGHTGVDPRIPMQGPSDVEVVESHERAKIVVGLGHGRPGPDGESSRGKYHQSGENEGEDVHGVLACRGAASVRGDTSAMCCHASVRSCTLSWDRARRPRDALLCLQRRAHRSVWQHPDSPACRASATGTGSAPADSACDASIRARGLPNPGGSGSSRSPAATGWRR
jgi:hypothetical protein